MDDTVTISKEMIDKIINYICELDKYIYAYNYCNCFPKRDDHKTCVDALWKYVKKENTSKQKGGKGRINMKKILDACCGSRMFWFDKNNENVVFMDNRQESCTLQDGRKLEVNPDVIGDFTKMPFDDETFYLVVFDPPHLLRAGKSSWIAKKYGILKDNWQDEIQKGFIECMRVLKKNGTLVFKWSEQHKCVGTAKCHPADAFNPEIGVRLAVTRAVQNMRKPFIPYNGQLYYYVNADRIVSATCFLGSIEDKLKIAMGNCFKTSEQAQANVDIITERLKKAKDDWDVVIIDKQWEVMK